MSSDIAAIQPAAAAQADPAPAQTNTTQGEDQRVAAVRFSAPKGGEGRRQSAFSDPPRLQITPDDATGHFVYRILDAETGEVIRQWPREQLLRMSEAARAETGSIFDRRV